MATAGMVDQVDSAGELALPPELMQRVALFIPDPGAFFAFLEAFHSTGVLGDLAMLFRLGDTCLHEKLWPHLCVGARPEGPQASKMLVVAKFYSHFSLSGFIDASWLQALCSAAPATGIVATDIRPLSTQPMEPFVMALAELPVKHATFSIPRSEIWVPFLPCLRGSLRSLRLTFHDHTGLHPSQLGALLEFVSASSQVTELVLENDPFCPPHVLTTAMISHVTTWFQTAAATHFSVGQWQLDQVDPSALTSLYESWATCSTLRSLAICETNLVHLKSFSMPLPMESLELVDCDLSFEAMKAFGLALGHSNVQSLTIRHSHTFKAPSTSHVPRGVRHLAGSFAFAHRLRRVVLSGIKCRDKGCLHLATALSTSQIQRLDLSRNHITDVGAAVLAQEIAAAAPCLNALAIDGNFLTSVGATALAHAAMSRHLTSLSVKDNQFDKTDVDVLNTLAQHHPTLRFDYKSTKTSKFFKRLST